MSLKKETPEYLDGDVVPPRGYKYIKIPNANGIGYHTKLVPIPDTEKYQPIAGIPNFKGDMGLPYEQYKKYYTPKVTPSITKSNAIDNTPVVNDKIFQPVDLTTEQYRQEGDLFPMFDFQNGDISKANYPENKYSVINLQPQGLNNIFNPETSTPNSPYDDITLQSKNPSIPYIEDAPNPSYSNTPGNPYSTNTYDSIDLESKNNIDFGAPTKEDMIASNEVLLKNTENQRLNEKQFPTFAETLLSNPLLNSGAGVNLNSKLFATGQSLTYDPSYLNNTEMQGKAKNANLVRGIAAGGASLLDIGRTVAQGAGYQKKIDEILKEYYAKQREKNYTYSEDGGTIQVNAFKVKL